MRPNRSACRAHLPGCCGPPAGTTSHSRRRRAPVGNVAEELAATRIANVAVSIPRSSRYTVTQRAR
jgi:hypothetical protein